VKDPRPELIAKAMSENSIHSFVEVGVWKGDLARQLLANADIHEYWMVDDWLDPAYSDKRCDAQAIADADSRVRLIGKSSVEAARMFRDSEVGMVYIDADHSYEAVRDDIAAWWPKASGMICGHDYVLWNSCLNRPCGVVPAVEEFAASIGREVVIDGQVMSIGDRLLAAYRAAAIEAPDHVQFPSWFIRKN